jgi:hypothetical protein
MLEPHVATNEPEKKLNGDVNPQPSSSTQKLILLWLLICFSASLVVSYAMVFATAIMPAINQNIIKDSLPLLLIPQFTLLGVALGFYFGQGK